MGLAAARPGACLLDELLGGDGGRGQLGERLLGQLHQLPVVHGPSSGHHLRAPPRQARRQAGTSQDSTFWLVLPWPKSLCSVLYLWNGELLSG